MARLTIIFDDIDPPLSFTLEHMPQHVREHISVAVLDLADGIEGVDIYNVAKKLTEMLMEQIWQANKTS